MKSELRINRISSFNGERNSVDRTNSSRRSDMWRNQILLIIVVTTFLGLYLSRIKSFTHRAAHYSPPLLVSGSSPVFQCWQLGQALLEQMNNFDHNLSPGYHE